ncbi:MAG: NrfD/PsrC family molybdoenzyme membrane anchor subunit [Candidatus Caldarchaeum sp.]
MDWEMFVVAGFVFSGLGSGAYIAAFGCDRRGVETAARLGTHLSWPLIGLSILFLFFDSQRIMPVFGARPLVVFENLATSMISIGTVLLIVFLTFSLLTSVGFWRAGWSTGVGRTVVWYIGLLLAVAVAVYPGFLLALSYGAAFWTSPFIMWLLAANAVQGGIALSGLSTTRLAGSLFPRFVVKDEKVARLFERYEQLAGVAALLLLTAHLIYTGFREASIIGYSASIPELFAGGLAPVFWAGVLLEFVIPPLLGLGRGKGVATHDITLASFISVLVGVFLLRWAIVAQGQAVVMFV